MAHGPTPEHTALLKSMVGLDNIRHDIDQISSKAFAENLISEGNKCLNTSLGALERTRSLKDALLGRTKSKPETYDTFVRILKETSGMDYIGDELEENLEAVMAEAMMRSAAGYIPHDPSVAENGIHISRAGGFDGNSVPVFSGQREYWDSPSPPPPVPDTQESPVLGYWTGMQPPLPYRKRSAVTPPPRTTPQRTLSMSRSRSLTPPPIGKRSEHSDIIALPRLSCLHRQAPSTPPFKPLKFNVRKEIPAVTSPLATYPPITTHPPQTTPPSSEQVDKTDDPRIPTNSSEQRRTVRFSTDSEAEAEMHTTPMPVQGEETSSNPSPLLVTGQNKEDTSKWRASLEVPNSPNLVMMRSYSTGSTDTESEYVTPRQSFSELEAEKLLRKPAKKLAMCKNCLSLRRSFSNSQEEICKLREKLQARHKLMLDQVVLLKEEAFQKELECCNLKETCTNAVVFVQELEATVSQLKQLVFSKETEIQDAWRHYEVSLDLLQRCSSPWIHHNPQAHSRATPNRAQDEFQTQQIYPAGSDSPDDTLEYFSVTKNIPGESVSVQNSQAQGDDFLPTARSFVQHPRKVQVSSKGSSLRSHQLLVMMNKSMVSPAKDSHPKKVYNVRSSRRSLQHVTHSATPQHFAATPGHLPRSSLQHVADHYCTATPEDSAATSTPQHHQTRHEQLSTSPESVNERHRFPQTETGYWKEGEGRAHDQDDGSFMPNSTDTLPARISQRKDGRGRGSYDLGYGSLEKDLKLLVYEPQHTSQLETQVEDQDP